MRYSVLAILFTVWFSVASAAECQLVATDQVLKKIARNEAVAKCSADSGFSFHPPPSKPTAAQLDAVCGVPSCRVAVNALVGMKLTSCTISMFNGVNLGQVVNTVRAHCEEKRGAKDNGAQPTPLSAAGPANANTKSNANANASVRPNATPTEPTAKATDATPRLNASPSGATGVSPATAKGKARLRKNCHQ